MDNTENPALGHLLAIREDIAAFRGETRTGLDDIRHRLRRIEKQIYGMKRDSTENGTTLAQAFTKRSPRSVSLDDCSGLVTNFNEIVRFI